MSNVRFLGLDVHANTIAVAVTDSAGETRAVGEIPNDLDAIRRLMKKLGPPEQLRTCYEAGPTGYALYWQLATLGIACQVVAPTLVPVKPGDRVKTDRRDAMKLSRSYRAGDLTPVWVPDAAHEALRDVVRAREAAKADQLRARHRLQKFLLRQGRRPPVGVKAWTDRYERWLDTVHFALPAQHATQIDYRHEITHAAERITRLEQAVEGAIQAAPATQRAMIEALQTLRGVARLTAATIVAEVGSLARFGAARQLMSYSGAVPSEASSGQHTRRGSITKTGNAHLRRVVIEAAWAYRHPPRMGPALKKRQATASPEVRAISWKAQQRLYRRYQHLTRRGKTPQQTVIALGRELLGFIWAIGVHAETAAPQVA